MEHVAKKVIEGQVVNKTTNGLKDKTIKVTTLLIAFGVILVLSLTFFAGWKANDMHEQQYNAEITRAVNDAVAKLK